MGGVILLEILVGDAQVAHGRLYLCVPQQFLYGSDIGAILQQVDGKGVPQLVWVHVDTHYPQENSLYPGSDRVDVGVVVATVHEWTKDIATLDTQAPTALCNRRVELV